VRSDAPAEIARLARVHHRDLDRRGALLVCVPVPDAAAMDGPTVDAAIEDAERRAADEGITGPARTPYLLDAVNRVTGGESLVSNLALLVRNAAVATDIARASEAGVDS